MYLYIKGLLLETFIILLFIYYTLISSFTFDDNMKLYKDYNILFLNKFYNNILIMKHEYIWVNKNIKYTLFFLLLLKNKISDNIIFK